MLLLENIYKTFDGVSIVKNFSLKVETGEKIAIIGQSGCGKSTMLRLIMGLHRPDSGNIRFNDFDMVKADKKQLRHIRMKFGLLFQSAALFDSMTVEENVAFPLVESLGLPFDKHTKKIVAEKLDMVEMDGAQHKMPAELSGGQKKRVGLARAIVANPEVVLYDEPTTGLDPVLSTNIEDLIVKLNNQLNITSIVVTHQISTILRTADKIYLMKDGNLLPPETPLSLKSVHNDYSTFLRGHI